MKRDYLVEMCSIKVAALLTLCFITTCTAVAPGDEDQECLTSPNRPSTVNHEILMASFNYVNLLENDGGPWIVVDEDENNDPMAGNSIPTVWLVH